jgi:beta-aspartyl-dipeptidase (metallo-type)
MLGTDDVTRTTGDLVVTARGLNADGLSAWCHTGGYHVPPVTLTGSVRSDITYVDRIIGVGEVAISDHRSSQPRLDEILRIAGDTHVGGLMTGKAGILHLHIGDGVRGLDLIRRALRKSEIPARVFDVGPEEDAWDAVDAMERYFGSGAPEERVTISSDGGGCLPVFDPDGRVTSMGVGNSGSLLHTLQKLAARGHALERILPPVTSNVATLLRLPRKGRVLPGFDADLVVLDAALNIRHVMARGVWHLRDGLVVRRGLFEQ